MTPDPRPHRWFPQTWGKVEAVAAVLKETPGLSSHEIRLRFPGKSLGDGVIAAARRRSERLWCCKGRTAFCCVHVKR